MTARPSHCAYCSAVAVAILTATSSTETRSVIACRAHRTKGRRWTDVAGVTTETPIDQPDQPPPEHAQPALF